MSEENTSVTTAEVAVESSRSIRIASWLFIINGIAWGLGTFSNAFYRYQLGEMREIGGLETMGGPISSQFGWQGVVWFLIPMGLLAWLEVLAGWWLRKGHRQGGWLAILLLPVSMFFWVGFLLPLWILLGGPHSPGRHRLEDPAMTSPGDVRQITDGAAY